MMDIFDLSNKHILVTGASSGIGKETSILLSRYGAIVSAVARREDLLKETIGAMEGNKHRYYGFDVSALTDISELVRDIIKDSGPIDGFIHCAGMGVNMPVSMTDADTVNSVMKTNFYSFVEFIRLLSKKKNSHDGASFVGVSSIASLKGDKSQGIYAASKAAMNAYIHPAAKELATRKIRVNTVAFGLIKTAAYQKFLEDGGQEDSLQEQYFGYGEPIEAATILLFMVSNASKLITGTTVICDCGYSS